MPHPTAGDRSDPGEPPALAVIEELCRMQLRARHLGCTIRVHEADGRLRELIELVGLGDVLLAAGTAGHRRSGRIEEDGIEEGVDSDHDGP